MAFDGKGIEILIASPSDVPTERNIVREAIADWNAVYARTRAAILLPIAWETHSSPELSGRPQQIINERLLVHADLLVGIFWTRVGSPTGKAISGSVEEIQEHMAQGKPVMLYFSNAPVAPDSLDAEQYAQLKEFKAWARPLGLFSEFESYDDFRHKFRHQLPITLENNPYLKSLFAKAEANAAFGLPGANSADAVTEDDYRLLKAAVDGQGTVYIIDAIGGSFIQAGQENLSDGTPREAARWKSVVRKLQRLGLISDSDGTGKYFEVTDVGYRLFEG